MSIFKSKYFNNMEKVKEYINNPTYLMDKKYEDNQRYDANPIEIILSLPLAELDSNLLVGEKNRKIFKSLSLPEQEALEYMLELKEEEKRYHQEYGYHRMYPKRKALYTRQLKWWRKNKLDEKYPYLCEYYNDVLDRKRMDSVLDRERLAKLEKEEKIAPLPPLKSKEIEGDDDEEDGNLAFTFYEHDHYPDDDNIEKIQEIPNSDKLEEQYKQSDERYDMEKEDRRIRGGKYKKKTRKTNKKKIRKTNKKDKNKKYNKRTRKYQKGRGPCYSTERPLPIAKEITDRPKRAWQADSFTMKYLPPTSYADVTFKEFLPLAVRVNKKGDPVGGKRK